MAENGKLVVPIPVDLLGTLKTHLPDKYEMHEPLAQILFNVGLKLDERTKRGVDEEIDVEFPDNVDGRRMLMLLRVTILAVMGKLENLDKRLLSLLG